MRINIRKVILGGMVAGMIIIILNVVAQIVLGDRVQREMNAWIPGSADRMSVSGLAITIGIILKFIIGILLIWLYSAIRSRFGPGPRTAITAAISVWILGAIFFSDFLFMGMMSVISYAIMEVLQLFTFIIATLVGARLYKEHAP